MDICFSNAASGKENHRRPLKILLIFLVLFALVIVTLAIVLASTVSTHRDLDNDKDKDVCLTEGCVMAAARLRGSMDHSINPCEDFYNFACGTWLKRQVIPADKGSINSFTQIQDDVSVILKTVLEAKNIPSDPEAVRKARHFYSMCMNDTQLEKYGLNGILNYASNLMGWPILGSNLGGRWNSNMELEDLMISMRKTGISLTLIGIAVGPDLKNQGHHILSMDQPSLGMPSRDYYLKSRDDKVIMAYQTMIQEFAIALGADENMAAKDAKDVVNFEIELAKKFVGLEGKIQKDVDPVWLHLIKLTVLQIMAMETLDELDCCLDQLETVISDKASSKLTVRPEDRRDIESMYNKMTVQDITTKYPGVKWLKFFQGIFSLTGETIAEDEPILVGAPDYFSKLGTILKKYPKRTIVNYMVGLRVIGMYFYLPAVFKEINLRYAKVILGTDKQAPRSQSCSHGIRDLMPEATGRMFVAEAFKKEAKSDVLNLVGNLKDAFKEIVDEIDWMGASTKRTAKEKADAMEARIGYPDIIYNDTALDEKYKVVSISGDNLLDTFISMNKAAVILNLKKLRKPVDYSEWSSSAATMNAFYNAATNKILFPAGIIQPPFYAVDEPGYLKYGGIGSVIGHEITHGFDDIGRLFDKNGKLESWWTKADAIKFKERTQCLIDQYSHYIVEGTGGMTLNGITTQGENIADNGGLKQSFKAYRNWVKTRGKEEKRLPGLPYNSNQLFFIKAAQIWCSKENPQTKIQLIRNDRHSLFMFRVYGSMQNFDDFSKVWNCPRESFMNKQNKCTVW